MPVGDRPDDRSTVFISKATPGDDEFALWLAPRLEAHGYKVFADIRGLEAGDRWRKVLTNTLQQRSIKMLLCCRDASLARDGVQDEIGIATDLAKELTDPRFIIPLRLEPYKKLFGIGELHYVDFVRGWAEGLDKLLEMFKRQKVTCDTANIQINPDWESFRRRGAVTVKDEPERLTSNWLRVAETPDVIRYFEPTGAVDRMALYAACARTPFPAQPQSNGFLTFASLTEVNRAFETVGKFAVTHEIDLQQFIADGSDVIGLRGQDARNILQSMFRQAWERMCRDRGLFEYKFSKASGFHATKQHARIGRRIPWGGQGDRRSSMLRNLARGHVWQFGVTGVPWLWPFPHFRLKSRVLFAPPADEDAGPIIEDTKKQHRLRRSVCKGWRNKQWHGRMMAFLELLSGESSFITLPLAEEAHIKLIAAPILFTSPVSTVLPNELDDAEEETDTTTLGRPEPEEEP